MYTRLHINPKSSTASVFLARIVEACDTLKYSPATHVDHAGMYVRYSAWGISCQFGNRVLNLPKEFETLEVTKIEMEVGFWQPELVTGRYQREHSSAVVTRNSYLDESRPDSYRFTIEADTLRAANRLFDDIVAGYARPKVAY